MFIPLPARYYAFVGAGVISEPRYWGLDAHFHLTPATNDPLLLEVQLGPVEFSLEVFRGRKQEDVLDF